VALQLRREFELRRHTLLVAALLVSFGILTALLIAAPLVHVVSAQSDPTVNMYPDFSVAPSTDTGCVGLTSTVSSQTGGLNSSAPVTSGSGYIDQEDTSYNTNEGGASFCSYDYSGSSFTITSASATLNLTTSGSTSDIWPVNVTLVDLTSGVTIATAYVVITNVSSAGGSLFTVTLNLASGATLTQDHRYGLVVSATSGDINNYDGLTMWTGPGNPSALTVSENTMTAGTVTSTTTVTAFHNVTDTAIQNVTVTSTTSIQAFPPPASTTTILGKAPSSAGLSYFYAWWLIIIALIVGLGVGYILPRRRREKREDEESKQQ
jgi:hypothetical protein